MASAGLPTGGQQSSLDTLSLPCGSVAGVPIRLHFLLPLVAGLAALGALASGHGLIGVIFAIILNGPLLLLTVLAHELGHIAAARRCGFTPDHILLWPLGGLAYISKDGITPKEQIFVSVSGPATHVPMMLLWAGILWVVNGGRVTLSTAGMWYGTHFIPVTCVAMLVNNLAMLFFNLFVPCIPLDCSQIFVSVMLLLGFEVSTAAKAMVFLSLPVILILFVYGMWAWLGGSAMASMTVLMAVWLGVQTYRLNQARLQGQLQCVPLFAKATNNASASSSTSASTYTGRSGRSFQMFEGTGRTLGDGGSGGGETIGKSTANEVCIASAVAVITNAFVLSQMTAPVV